MNRIIVTWLLVITALTLKSSQAGVNDWAINTLGEVRDISFSKNKIYFLSYLNSMGILDKYTGKVQSRSMVGQSEKMVGYGDMILNSVTRYNQVVSHFMTATGLDKKTTYDFKVDNRTVQWITTFNANQYFITKSSFHHGRDIVRVAENQEIYLRVINGKESHGKFVYLLYRDNHKGIFCIENYDTEFRSKYCSEKTEKTVEEFQFYQGHLILGLTDSTLLLSGQLKLTNTFQERVVQFSNGAIVMLSKCFRLKDQKVLDKRPVKTVKRDTEIFLVDNEVEITLYRDDLRLFSFVDQRRQKVLRSWFNFRSQMEFDLLIQYSDLELVCYSIVRDKVQQTWKRQQSLAYVKEVIFMKYHQIDTLDNDYHRSLLTHSYKELSLSQKISQMPKLFLLRLQQELLDFKLILESSINYLIVNIGSIRTIDRSSFRKFQMPPEQQMKYGLRKYIIVATDKNTIIAIDTKFNQILWKINRHLNSQIVKFVHLKRDYQTEVALLVSYSPTESQTFIEEINQNGERKILKTFSSQQLPSIYKLNDHNLILKFGDKIQKFELFQQDDLAEKEFYFYSQEGNQINGWKAVGDTIVKIWNFETRGGEQILKIAAAFRGDQTANIPLFDSEKVFFKNVDFTNLALLTSYNKAVALYIINGRTGKIHYNSFKNSSSLNMPINLVYDQNNVLVSYFNHKNKNFQIWTVEQYQQRIQTKAVNMINDFIKGNQYTPQESKERTIFQEEIYGVPVYIKHMQVSQSKMSLTRRNLFIITGQNKLYTIGRDFVSTRRPHKDRKSFFANQKYPEYAYFLPYTPQQYLSYSHNLANLNQIVFSPTDMESTIFTLCYGSDLFMIRNSPDKTFDMITEDFNYLVLLIILAAATVGILTFRRIMNKAKILKPHIQ